MRLGVTMAIDTPSHRLIFGLVNNIHFVDTTVARYARYTSRNVNGVIEVDIIGQSVDPNPVDRFARSPTIVNRLELFAFRMNSRKRGSPRGAFRTVAVNASLSRWNRRMRGLLNGVVAITTIHLQLASVQCMTERNRLLGAVTDIESNRAGRSQKQYTSIGATTSGQNAQHRQKFIGPSREQESLCRHT